MKPHSSTPHVSKPSADQTAAVLSSLPDISDIADLNIPFDASLDISAYINATFPDEASLSKNVDPFLSRLDATLSRLDAQLANLVRDHRSDGAESAKLLEGTLSSVASLQERLISLTDAARMADEEMQRALAPAKPLYTALENTVATAAALEALVGLEHAVEKLETAAGEISLAGVAGDLTVFSSVRDSLALFDNMSETSGTGLRKLPELRARAAVAIETLRCSIFSEFKRMSDVVSMAGSVEPSKLDDAVARLRTACLVAQAMGKDVIAEVIGSFVRGRKLAFRAAFAMDKRGFAGVEKRFAWLRRELRMNWARLGGERIDRGWGVVFPNDWGVAWRVADGIVRELRDWTSATLDAGADRDVAVMVSALSKTKEFESELDQRFNALKRQSDEMANLPSFAGTISESYGPWMGAYVNQEDEHLRVVLLELLRDEKWVCEDGAVLGSATELFLVIKKSMRTCASLDIRQPLFSLHRVFRKHLGSYASSLVKHLPGVRGNALADSSTPEIYATKVQRVCDIINTAEYCSSTIAQLEESLQNTVQEVFAGDIELNAVKESFGAVAARGVQSIVTLLIEDLEIHLRELSTQDWAAWPEVGDTSKYVESISTKLTASAKSLFGQLSKHHFRFLLEKFAAAFIPRYRFHVYKCQELNNFGAQQILLDASAIKALLLGLPASIHAPVPGTYVKFVNRETSKIEAMLKVILAPVDMSVDTYVALVPQGTAEHFQKILEMRGLRRAEAAPLVLDYSRRIGPSQRLRPQTRERAVFEMPQPVPQSTEGRSVEGSSAQSIPTRSLAKPSGQNQNEQGQSATVDSMKSLFGRLGTSFMDSGISDRLGQVSSQFESTTDRLKREAAARGFRFGQ